MFYIQKNDKPNIIEKTFNIIKMQENAFYGYRMRMELI